MKFEKDEQCEYELQRQERIAENEAMFKQLFPDGPLGTPKQQKEKLGKSRPNTERVSRKLAASPYPTRKNPSRHCKVKRRVKYGSDCEDDDRSSDFEADQDTYDQEEDCKSGSLVVKLWGARKNVINSPETKRRSQPRQIVDRTELLKNYSMLTEEDLILVAEKTSDKRYDQSGTTCHQCRQKTDDLKTLCRASDCSGVKGQFCGPCLRNRYGEDAKKAIMKPDWVCPPCRGICNCSFCMAKRGRKATGILIHIAKGNGYDSVKSFLGD